MDLNGQYLSIVKKWAMFKIHTVLQRSKGIEAVNDFAEIHINNLLEELQETAQKAVLHKILIPMDFFLNIYKWNEFEKHVIYLLTAFELSEELTYYSAVINENNSMGYITPVMAIATFDYTISEEEVNYALSEDSALFQLLLTESLQEENSHYMKLSMDRRMRLFFLNGITEYSPYKNFMSWFMPGEKLDFLMDEKGILNQLEIISSESKEGQKLLISLFGLDGVGKLHYYKHLARKKNQVLIILEVNNLSLEWYECLKEIKKYVRECCLLQAMPVIKMGQAKNWQQADELKRFRYILNSLFYYFNRIYITADTSFLTPHILPNIENIQIKLDEPSLIGKLKLWEEEAKQYMLSSTVSLESIGNRYLLTPGKIKEAMKISARHCLLNERTEIEEQDIQFACYSLMEQNMDNKAVSVQTVYLWDQLVLPKDQKNQLFSVLHQVKYKHLVYESWGLEKTMAYGRGISVLLYGPPGTGKTMAAQVLANELGMELYRIQLASIFSKYIGETEKNLQDIFTQAKRNQMILFFDEADILFSKRTEVKDSNDKYSNMEAAFLLQKLEEYDGVSILATNYYKNFDEAFKRRIQYMVEFPFPNQEDRRTIWEKAFPPEMPKKEIDLDFLSGFELSGSHIKNIVLKSAFAAAAKKEAVKMIFIMQALKQEFEKIGKVITQEEAGEYFDEI